MKKLFGLVVTLGVAAVFAVLPVVPPHAHAADTSPPTSPTNVTASLSQYNRIAVSWQPSKDNVKVAGYVVYRNGTFATSTPGTGFWEYVTPGNTYSYTVTAYDTSGNMSFASAPSDPISVLKDVTPPSTPNWLTITPGTSSIKLSWSAAQDNVGIQRYALYRDESPNPVTSTPITATTYTDIGLRPGTKYHYALVAYDYAQNVSTPNTTDTATLSDITPPTVPQSLTATPVSDKEIDLAWDASFDSAGVAGYYVYRNGSKFTTVTSTAFANIGLKGNTSYLYAVAAFDAAGNVSAKTYSVQATTLAPDTSPPSIPRNFEARAVSASEIDLTWSSSTDNVGVAGYDLYRGDQRITTAASTTTSYADKNLATSTTYQYSLRAFDAASNRSGITTVAATTLSYTPAAPSAMTSTASTSSASSSAPAQPATSTPSPTVPSPAPTTNKPAPTPLPATTQKQNPTTTASTTTPASTTAPHLEGTPVAKYIPPETPAPASGTASTTMEAPSTGQQSSFFVGILGGISSFWSWLTHLL